MTKLPGKVERGPSTLGGGFARLRERVVAVCESAAGWVNSLRLHIRPRVLLLAGSVLMLFTLYLPTVASSSGDPLPGLQLASGSGDTTWPSWFLFSSPETASTVFYLLCLLAAAFTVLFLLASVVNRNLVGNRGLLTGLVAITGSMGLLSTADTFCLAALILATSPFYKTPNPPMVAFILLVFLVPAALLQPEFRTVKRIVVMVFILGGIAAVLSVGADDVTLYVLLAILPVACLRPEFWTKNGGVAWIFILAGVISAFWLGYYLLDRIGYCSAVPSAGKMQEVLDYIRDVANPFAIAFTFFPLVLWLRHGRLGRTPSRHRPDVGRRLAIFYSGAVAVDLLGIVANSYWGLIPFFLGVYLIFFGYWQLRWAMNGSAPG